MQQLQNLQSSYFKDTRICVEVDKVDRTAADDGVASHALPFLLRRRATREQRATLCLSLSYTASSPSEDRFDVKHFFFFQNLFDDNPCCCTFAATFSAFCVAMLSKF